MKRYLNLNRNSGVEFYDIFDNYIVVKFKGGKNYKYSYRTAGKIAIEKMKHLADSGKGLSAYIAKQKPPFVK